MTQEALKLALEALEWCHGGEPCGTAEAIAAIKEALAQPEQEPVAWKLMPRDATDSMLKAMDECSTEGYDERLYAGHAASVYMAAWDAAPITPAEQEPVAWEQFYPDIGKPQIEQPKVRTGDCLLVGVCASEGHKIQAKQEPWGESASDYERGFVDGMQYQMQSMSQSQQEPVEYQMRTRPTWEVTSFSDWKKCSRDAFDDYTKTPKLHDWEYEVRKLYTTPPQRKPPTVDVRILQAVSDEYNAWIRAHASGMGYDDFLLQRLAAHDIKEST